MSDRVAIIGGSTVGWDHFPFAVTDDPLLDTTSDGFVSDLDAMMKWYWRVKVWHIEAVLDAVAPLSFSTDFDITNATLNSFADREAGLVDPPGEVFFYTNNFGDAGDIQMTVYYNPGAGLAHLATDSFFFPFLVHCWSPDLTVQNREADLGEGGHAPDTTIAGGASLDGVTNNAYYFRGVGPAIAASITVTPLEYWPYATKAGLPVYDTSTEAQLRDPLS